jgi:hypothetical protein
MVPTYWQSMLLLYFHFCKVFFDRKELRPAHFVISKRVSCACRAAIFHFGEYVSMKLPQ